ncbi:MAG: transketolase [Clostridia bacterium]|nr:transketolase [Clostridia bacterium]
MKLEVNRHNANILRMAEAHPEILVLSADLGTSCEVKEFRQKYPDRYITTGIAEQNMVSWAAGLAREGFRPFLHTVSVFLYRRVLDQVEMSIAYPNLPVVFCGFVPGITTPGGVTHQSTNDVGVIRTVPNFTIFDVGDATEIDSVLDLAYACNGPVYIRQLRKNVPRLFPEDKPMEFNRARVIHCENDADVTIFSSSICTEEAMRATAALTAKGVKVNHLHISTLKPFTDPQVVEACRNSKYGVLTIENHTVLGGLGTCVAEVMAENAIGKPLIRIGLQDTYANGASKMQLLKYYKMDAMALVQGTAKLMGKDLGISESDLEEIRFEDFSAV